MTEPQTNQVSSRGLVFLSPAVEILAIGNEVLAGNVIDTNSHWLCQQLAARGASIRRVTVLPDEPAEIADCLQGALVHAPRLIITCGGLGPTRDDLTVAAIAAALGLELIEHPAAFAMVRDFYVELAARGDVTTAEMLPARSKMAQMPAGAEPLRNAVGAAPGVLLTLGATTIVSLPGVPAEMKDIFSNSLGPRLPTLIETQSLHGARRQNGRVGRIGAGSRGRCGSRAPSSRLCEVEGAGLRRRRGSFRHAGRAARTKRRPHRCSMRPRKICAAPSGR